MSYYYITFANDEGFLGATVVKALSPDDAINEATKLDLNPGGEAMVLPLPSTEKVVKETVGNLMNRLVGFEELMRDHRGVSHDSLDPKMAKLIETLSTTFKQKPN